MRQILLNDRGALIARMPRPALDEGTLLVRVRYSLVSTGTELSGLRAGVDPAEKGTVTERARASAGLARHYLKAAIAEPDRAMRRVAAIARGLIAALRPSPAPAPKFTAGDLTWTRHAATTLEASAEGVRVLTDASSGAYQAAAGPIPVDPGTTPVVSISGVVENGAVRMVLLNEAGDRWLGSRVYE